MSHHGLFFSFPQLFPTAAGIGRTLGTIIFIAASIGAASVHREQPHKQGPYDRGLTSRTGTSAAALFGLGRQSNDTQQQEEGNLRVPRNALPTSSDRLWNRVREQDPGGGGTVFIIPYSPPKPSQFNPSEVSLIEQAMAAIGKATCVHFRPRRAGDTNYVDITKGQDQRCNAGVGRSRRSGVPTAVLFSSSCMRHELIMHELLHTVGLKHEHQRTDRDQFVTIHMENVNGNNFKPAFDKLNPSEGWTTYGVPYSFQSVMHYGKFAFAKNSRSPTIEARDKNYKGPIGGAKDAAPEDYAKVCAMYGCKRCPGAKAFWNDALGRLANQPPG